MLGPIIVDLAIDTRNRDIDVFYRQLFDEGAQLSNYGRAAMKFAGEMIRGHPVTFDEHLDVVRRKGDSALKSLELILWGYCGWTNQNSESAVEQAHYMRISIDQDKDSFYSANILPVIVSKLRSGRTKDEALLSVNDMFRAGFLNWDRKRDDVLGAINRAWDAFYRSFDFTSALHSAAKSPVNPHLTTIVCSLFAEAMYSCEQLLLKKKYSVDGYHFIACPDQSPRSKSLYGAALLNTKRKCAFFIRRIVL